MRHSIPLALVGALFLAAPAVGAPRVAPEPGGPWAVTGKNFTGVDKRLAFSGLACAPPGGSSCLLVTDEGHKAAAFKLSGNAIDFLDRIDLTKAPGELDAEGVAVDGGYFYVTGSHSLKRQDCGPNPDSRNVFRIAQKAGAPTGEVETAKDALWKVLQSLDALKAYTTEDACPGTRPRGTGGPGRRPMNGVDIEGIAATSGRLYFGLRGPALDGDAFIVSVDAAGLFSGDVAAAKGQIFRMRVGTGRSFRDLTVWSGEIFALVGPNDDSPPVDFSIFKLEGLAGGAQPAARELATLDLSGAPAGQDKTGKPTPIKPEALAILSEDAKYYRALVLSDSGMDGAPLVFLAPR